MTRPASRALALLLLFSLPSALSGRGELIVSDANPCMRRAYQDATATLGLAEAAENEGDFEDDFDDVLLNDFRVEHPRVSPPAPAVGGPMLSRLSSERPLRPPIG